MTLRCKVVAEVMKKIMKKIKGLNKLKAEVETIKSQKAKKIDQKIAIAGDIVHQMTQKPC